MHKVQDYIKFIKLDHFEHRFYNILLYFIILLTIQYKIYILNQLTNFIDF